MHNEHSFYINICRFTKYEFKLLHVYKMKMANENILLNNYDKNHRLIAKGLLGIDQRELYICEEVILLVSYSYKTGSRR